MQQSSMLPSILPAMNSIQSNDMSKAHFGHGHRSGHMYMNSPGNSDPLNAPSLGLDLS